mmetsp:Transcript_14152/g.21803  ORF Transcript_14152/g.21803 Transcript_14152/m.21803 type:complete len:452 (+) Transcript_14152:69-1424(+)
MSERRKSRRVSSRQAELPQKKEETRTGRRSSSRRKRLDDDDDDKKPKKVDSKKNRATGENNTNNNSKKNNYYDDRSYTWLDDSGNPTPVVKQKQYPSLRMVLHGRTTIVTVGDTVLLASSDETANDEESFVGKVEGMWQSQTRKIDPIEYGMKLRVRWYFKKNDVNGLNSKRLRGPMSKKRLMQSMTNKDLILSDQYDENDVLTLLRKCTVVHRRPTNGGDDCCPISKNNKFVSRYRIHFTNDGSPVVTAYDGIDEVFPSAESEDDYDGKVATEIVESDEETETVHTTEDGPEHHKVAVVANMKEKATDNSSSSSKEDKTKNGDRQIMSSAAKIVEEETKVMNDKDAANRVSKRKRKSTTMVMSSEGESDDDERQKQQQENKERKASVILMRTDRKEFTSTVDTNQQDTSYLDDDVEDENFQSDEDGGDDTQFSFGAKWIASQESPTAASL